LDSSDYQLDFSGHSFGTCSGSQIAFSGVLVYATIDSTYVRVEVNAATGQWFAYYPDGTKLFGLLQTAQSVGANNATLVNAIDSDAGEIMDRNGNYLLIEGLCPTGQACTETLIDSNDRSITINYGASTGQSSWSDTITWQGVDGQLTSTVNWETIAPGSYYCPVPGSGATALCTLTIGGVPVDQRLLMPEVTVVSSVQLPTAQLPTVTLPVAASEGSTTLFDFTYSTSVNNALEFNAGELYSVAMCSETSSGSCGTVQYGNQYQISYTYQNNPKDTRVPGLAANNPVTSRTVSYAEIVSGGINVAGATTYADGDQVTIMNEQTLYSIPVPGAAPAPAYPSAGTSTVTNPDGSQIQYNMALPCPSGFPVGDFCQPVVYETVYPDQSKAEMAWAANGTTTFSNTSVAATAFPSAPTGAVINPYVQYTVKTPAPAVSGNVSAALVSNDTNGNPTTLQECDWFASTAVNRTASGLLAVGPCNPTRITTPTYYEASNAPPYWTYSADPNTPNPWRHLRAKQSVTVGSLITNYSYDNYQTTANMTQAQQWDSLQGKYISTSYQYLANGNISQITDPNNNITKINYAGPCGNLYPSQSVAASNSTTIARTTSFSIDCNSGLTNSVTDQDNGITTTYAYDSVGRAVLVTQTGKAGSGLSRYTETQYDDINLIATTTQQQTASSSLTSQTYYDALGRVRFTTDPAQNQAVNAYRYGSGVRYQLSSNPFQTTGDSTIGWTLTTADNMGRVTSVQNYHGAAPPSPWNSNSTISGNATQAYNQTSPTCTGPATTVTDAASNTHTYCTDGLGRQTAVVEPNGNVTSYGYDLLNNLTNLTQGSQTRKFNYTSLSRLQSSINPESGTASSGPATVYYTYDNNGNLLTRTDARTTITTMNAYDALNRITGVSYSGGTAATTSSVAYTYDTDFHGALSSVANSASSTTYAHDGFGRVVGSSQNTSGQPAQPFSYLYSLTDQLTWEKYPSGRSITYTLDTAGRVTGVSGSLNGSTTPYVSNITYLAPGVPSAISLGNTVTQQFGWNDRLQQTSVTAGTQFGLNFYPRASGQTICSNNNGNILQETISANGAVQATEQFTYDSLNRLTLADEETASSFTPACPDTNASAVWYEQYSYDTVGNRTVACESPNLASLPWEVGSISSSTNQIPGWGYDPAGNVTAPTAPTITYDAENRQVTNCPPLGCETYVYDGSAQRVQKYSTSSPSTTTVTYVYDAFGNLAAEYGATEPGLTAASGTQYLAMDHLGSTRLVMGAQTERHDYLPFGYEVTGGWRTAGLGYGPNTVPQKFTGQIRDNETGLDYFQARYYSAAQGRFLSPDPGNAGADPSDPQTWNGYAYVGNNPLSRTDPSGLVTLVWGGIGPSAAGGPIGMGVDFLAELGMDFLTYLLGGGPPPTGVRLEFSTPVFSAPAIGANSGWFFVPATGVWIIPGLTFQVTGTGKAPVQSKLCNDQNALGFVKAHLGDASGVAGPLQVPVQNILGLSAAESGWGRDWNVQKGRNNFFSLQGNGSSPFANGVMYSGGGTALSTFPSYRASAMSFAKQYGSLVKGQSNPTGFATKLVPGFNPGRAPFGNPHFISDLAGVIGNVSTLMGCKSQ
jgi:RHS repeat-associated protein